MNYCLPIQINTFGPFFFIIISMHEPYQPFWKIAKMALFNPCMKIKKKIRPNVFIWSAAKPKWPNQIGSLDFWCSVYSSSTSYFLVIQYPSLENLTTNITIFWRHCCSAGRCGQRVRRIIIQSKVFYYV